MTDDEGEQCAAVLECSPDWLMAGTKLAHAPDLLATHVADMRAAFVSVMVMAITNAVDGVQDWRAWSDWLGDSLPRSGSMLKIDQGEPLTKTIASRMRSLGEVPPLIAAVLEELKQYRTSAEVLVARSEIAADALREAFRIAQKPSGVAYYGMEWSQTSPGKVGVYFKRLGWNTLEDLPNARAITLRFRR